MDDADEQPRDDSSVSDNTIENSESRNQYISRPRPSFAERLNAEARSNVEDSPVAITSNSRKNRQSFGGRNQQPSRIPRSGTTGNSSRPTGVFGIPDQAATGSRSGGVDFSPGPSVSSGILTAIILLTHHSDKQDPLKWRDRLSDLALPADDFLERRDLVKMARCLESSVGSPKGEIEGFEHFQC